MICFAPIVLAGYMFTLQTPWHHTAPADGVSMEVQTCPTGLGAHGKVSTAGLFGAGVHYGVTKQWTGMSLTLQPKAGLSYVDHALYALPQRTQFELGAMLLLDLDRLLFGLEYWHLSNAGMKSPNVGMDFIGLTSGWRF